MSKTDQSELENIRQEIRDLKQRLLRVEEALTRGGTGEPHPLNLSNEKEATWEIGDSVKSEESVEFRFGEYGLAWIGNIVLLLGIIFLVQYIKEPTLSAIVGYCCVGAMAAAAHFSKKSFAHLGRLLDYSAGILLFYVTLRLHFFTPTPLISGKSIVLGLLVIVNGILLLQAHRHQSSTKAAIALLFLLFTGAVSNSSGFAALLTTLGSGVVLFLFARHGWIRFLFVFVLICYLFHANWLFGNPIAGNSPGLIESPGVQYLGFLLTAVIFSAVATFKETDSFSKEFLIATVVWNGLHFSVLLLVSTLFYFQQSYIALFTPISVVCLLYSVLLHKRFDIKLTAAMYALYGFLAMSVAFYGIFLLPKAYALLSLQSLLVVSMALWFRSKFIVLMNSLLYLFLLILYLLDTASYSGINISFMGVAFLSARIMNWQKERLELKTDFIRNIYLAIGFMMTLITFYHASPEKWITASWILAAVLFFITSLLLKNVKYRWLAIATVIASAIKLIFVDMISIDIGYRVLFFMILAIVSISASVAYTKYYKDKKDQ